MNCLVIDDEFLARELMEFHIGKIPGWKVLAKLENPLDALPILNSREVDVLFLDIQMPEISGIDFLKSLPSRPSVVLTTAYSEYALEAFGLDVVDYLVKPVSFSRFLQCVSKIRPKSSGMETAVGSGSSNSEAVIVKSHQKIVRIPLSDLWFVEGQKEYVCYYAANGQFRMLEALKNIELQLPTDRFFRVHKSYIVNLNAIHSLEGNELLVTGGFRVPIGPLYREAFIHWFTGNR